MTAVERLAAALDAALDDSELDPSPHHSPAFAEAVLAADPGLAEAIDHGLARAGAEQERDALAAQVVALREALEGVLGFYEYWPPALVEAHRVLSDTAAAGEAARQRIVAEANLRHHDAVRAVDAADEEDRQRIVTDWLASPEAERALAEVLHDADGIAHPVGGTWTPGTCEAHRAMARAILAALRGQGPGR